MIRPLPFGPLASFTQVWYNTLQLHKSNQEKDYDTDRKRRSARCQND